jgi:hypothetical protein
MVHQMFRPWLESEGSGQCCSRHILNQRICRQTWTEGRVEETGGCRYAIWFLAVNGEYCKAVTLPLVFHRTKSENVESDCSDGAALKTGGSLNTTTEP